jgi:DNA-binding NarL/FixJ family response regulator
LRFSSMSDAVSEPDDPKSLRILVVDDHAVFRKQVCAFLETQAGFEVICEAGDGLEGIRQAEGLQPDVIVLDVSMPTLGGIEAAVRIRKVAPKSRIVFLSQHNSEGVARAALATGAHAFVTKVNAATDLILAVQAVLEGKNFVSQVQP